MESREGKRCPVTGEICDSCEGECFAQKTGPFVARQVNNNKDLGAVADRLSDFENIPKEDRKKLRDAIVEEFKKSSSS